MFQKCDKCGRGIGFNEGYVAITYNLQKQTHDLATQQNVIDIKHSEIVMVFCGNCGNQHNAHKMTESLKLKELVYQEISTPEIPEVARELEVKKTKTRRKLTFEERMEIRTYPTFVQPTLTRIVEESSDTESIQELYDKSIKDLVKYFT